MSDVLPPIGFWSYARDDDRRSGGRLSQLRRLLTNEIESQHGRIKVTLFQDLNAIDYGELWQSKIEEALAQCSFLIPILTPGFFQSEWCCREVLFFLEREKQLGRGSLIFPISWVKTDPEDAAHAWSRDVWDHMLKVQTVCLTPWRHYPLDSTLDVLSRLSDLAGTIKAALRRPVRSLPPAPIVPPPPPPPPQEPPRPVSAPARPRPIVAPPPPPPPPPKPAWASAIGTDQFGDWADIAVPAANGKIVTQRLRAIPSGKFRMGSPDTEEGRFGDEGPVHEVAISQGFWLFDTPCTQELWQGVMGKNPSMFKGPKRPVEKVNIADIAEFLTALDGLMPGLGLTLPSEAQWEYACRAGTSGPNYAKPGQSLGDIAWYTENSGGTTHDVKGKAPNDWGLYDMLGNVWEWCADGWVDNYKGAPTDGSARPADGPADRAFRGGSWFVGARSVRAACRDDGDPSYPNDYLGFRSLGFRCARVRNSD